MAFKRKSTHTKAYAAIILVILAIASVAIVYAVTHSSSKPIVPGVHVGDTFTYKLTGDSILFDTEAVTPAYLYEYNETNFYEVIITGVNGSRSLV